MNGDMASSEGVSSEPQAPQDDAVVRAKQTYEITREEVLRFLNEKEKPGAGRCPICDTDLWGTVTPAEGGTVNLIVGDLGGLIGRGAINCIALSCENCGYVRLHATNPIVKWKNKA